MLRPPPQTHTGVAAVSVLRASIDYGRFHTENTQEHGIITVWGTAQFNSSDLPTLPKASCLEASKSELEATLL